MNQPAVSVAGNLRITDPVNEPVRDYRPGSPEAVALHAELDRVRGEVRELPNVINGERLPLGETVDVVAPHDHAHVLGRYSPADSRQVDAAIAAALAARADWSRTPWWDRAAVLLRAAELVSGKYRNELLATTMLGQSKTFHQAEIDAACELADFFRYNAHFAAQIYETQPPSPPGEFNYLDQRGLEGLRPGHHPVQLHGDRRQPADHRRADGQHGRLEAVGEVRAQQRRGDAGPRGGGPAARA